MATIGSDAAIYRTSNRGVGMALLRIRQLPGKEGRYRAELRLEDDGPAFEAAAADIQKTQQLLADIEKDLASS